MNVVNEGGSARRGDEAYFSLGFLTALVSHELKGCESALQAAGWAAEEAAPYLQAAAIDQWSKVIDGRKIVAYSMAIGRMGQTSSAIETFCFLSRIRPNLLFMTGIAGSLQDTSVFKGDVVISRSIRWRTQNKVYGEEECDTYRPYDHPLNAYSADLDRLVQKYVCDRYPSKDRSAVELEKWNVHAGEIYSWDYVINSRRVVDTLNRQFPSSLCVEMEGGGFRSVIDRFAELNGGRAMLGYVVKGISDYASRKDKDASVRAAASRNAAEVAVELAEWMVEKQQIIALKQAILP